MTGAAAGWSQDRPRNDLILFLFLALACYWDKLLLGPLAFIDIYDSVEVHYAHFQSMWRLWVQYGPFSWYPFHAGGVPSFVGQHPPYHPAVFLCGVLPLWLVSLLWNIGQMVLAGYGMSRFLPLLLKVSRQTALVCSALFAIVWAAGNVHFVLPYAFPAMFCWTVELFRADSSRKDKSKAALGIVLVSLFSFPVLTLPHFPVLHLALVLFLGRQLPDFRRQVVGVFLVWTGYVLLFLPSIVSLYLYIPFTQREWTFEFTGLGPALLDFLRWLRGRLADQQFIAFVLLGLPLARNNRRLRLCYLFILVMLLVSGVFTSDLKGLFTGTFLVKMDLFMFATALGIVGCMVAALVLDELIATQRGPAWYWLLATVGMLSLLGSAHKVLVYLSLLGAGLALAFLLRSRDAASDKLPTLLRGKDKVALGLTVCLALAAMLLRQQYMTTGMYAPYAQGLSDHAALEQLAQENRTAPFRVACVDVHPLVAQARGLDTVGEKSPLFNRYYKELVREAVRPQFTTPTQELEFTNLWRQLYLTRLKTDLDQRGFVLERAPQRSAADFNWTAMRVLGVREVIASKPINGMERQAAQPPGLSSGPAPALQWLGGLSAVYDLPLWLYRLDAPLPRVFLADPQLNGTPTESLRAMVRAPQDQIGRKAFVVQVDAPTALLDMMQQQSEISMDNASTSPDHDSAPGEVLLRSWSPDALVLEGDAKRPCVLVAANNYDPRWKAELTDGSRLAVFRADHAFQGVFLDRPGPFVLQLRFSDPLVWWLHLFALLGLGLLCGAAITRPCLPRRIPELEYRHPGQLAAPSLPRTLIAGVLTALVWAAAFLLFVMSRQRGPQAIAYPYALATIPLMGVCVSCWARGLIRRLS